MYTPPNLHDIHDEADFLIARFMEWWACHDERGMPVASITTMARAYLDLFCPNLSRAIGLQPEDDAQAVVDKLNGFSGQLKAAVVQARKSKASA